MMEARQEELLSEVFDLLLSIADFEAFKEVRGRIRGPHWWRALIVDIWYGCSILLDVLRHLAVQPSRSWQVAVHRRPVSSYSSQRCIRCV